MNFLDAGEATLLKGARNFRAVQSFRGDGGRLVRANTIYRSGELSRLDAEDLQVIESLNIRLVCDLRTEREQAEFVSRWPDSHVPVRLDLPDRGTHDAGPHRLFEMIAQFPGGAGAELAMQALYRRKPRAYVESLAPLFDALVAGDGLPVLIHCHAGKDRTGFIIAMLLSAVGVAYEDVVEDYVTTVKYFPVEREAKALAAWAERSFGQKIDPDSAVPLVDARREFLAAAFEEIEKGFGGVEAYLRAAGLDDEKRERLRALLLV
jgi:protein-tyrosine phosphatase